MALDGFFDLFGGKSAEEKAIVKFETSLKVLPHGLQEQIITLKNGIANNNKRVTHEDTMLIGRLVLEAEKGDIDEGVLRKYLTSGALESAEESAAEVEVENMDITSYEALHHLYHDNDTVSSQIDNYWAEEITLDDLRDKLDFARYTLSDDFEALLEQLQEERGRQYQVAA